jgi:hypothetical protein
MLHQLPLVASIALGWGSLSIIGAILNHWLHTAGRP